MTICANENILNITNVNDRWQCWTHYVWPCRLVGKSMILTQQKYSNCVVWFDALAGCLSHQFPRWKAHKPNAISLFRMVTLTWTCQCTQNTSSYTCHIHEAVPFGSLLRRWITLTQIILFPQPLEFTALLSWSSQDRSCLSRQSESYLRTHNQRQSTWKLQWENPFWLKAYYRESMVRTAATCFCWVFQASKSCTS